MKNYYTILELNKDFSPRKLRKSYRKKALSLHSKVLLDNEAYAEFIELTEAYEVLKNNRTKLMYDLLLDQDHSNKESANDRRLKRKVHRWKSKVDKAINKGRGRGEKYANQPRIKLRRRTSWGYFAFEFILLTLEILIGL